MPTTTFGEYYRTGTVNLTAGATAFSGNGVAWADIEQGDILEAQGRQATIDTITGAGLDAGTFMLVWPGTTAINVPYVIRKDAKARFDPALTQAKLREFVAEVSASGIFYAVEGAAPDDAIGEDGQYALKTNTGVWKQWLKVAGHWVLQATPIGTTNRGIWSSVTAYAPNDIVAYNGRAYVSITSNTNKVPDSNISDWALIGDKGDQGIQGIQGVAGNTVLYNTGAPANSLGVDGNFYVATDTHFIYGPKAGGVWPAGTNLVGPSGGTGAGGAIGAAGLNGKTVRYGTGAPNGTIGAEEDFYIAIDLNTIYGPKSGGVWPAGRALTGPQGIPGPQGQGINYGASGTLAQRATYDNQPQGFAFLQTDIAPFRVWVKASNTTADWAGPTYIGGIAAVGDLGSVTDSVVDSFDYGVAA